MHQSNILLKLYQKEEFSVDRGFCLEGSSANNWAFVDASGPSGKRGRTKRPRKNINKIVHNSPSVCLSDSSIFDSDIENQNRIIFKEAEATWAMSSSLGFNFARNHMQLVEVFSSMEEDSGEARWLWGNESISSEFILSQGNSGGLVTVWKDNFFEVEHKIMSQRFLLLIGVVKNIGFRCGVGNIYAPNDDVERNEFWVELSGVINSLGVDEISDTIQSGIGFLLGDGSRIAFWNQEWISRVVLRFSFPRIFALVENKNGKVKEFGSFINGVWVWNIQLRRSLFDWERNQWDNLMTLLKDYQVCENLQDKLIWKGNTSMPARCSNKMWLMSFDAILWTLWISRNEVVFRGKVLEAEKVVDMLKFRISAWAMAKWPQIDVCFSNLFNNLANVVVPTKRSQSRVLCSWSKPHAGSVKFNVDGSSLGKR
ncbi:hypothetical protein PTKIN_Ptkin08bG0180300 [Pterospermum kingtungense]